MTAPTDSPASGSGSYSFSMTKEEVIRIQNAGAGNEWPKVWNRQLNELCDVYIRALAPEDSARGEVPIPRPEFGQPCCMKYETCAATDCVPLQKHRASLAIPSAPADPFPATGLEPSGCPTPGACSCPGASASGETPETDAVLEVDCAGDDYSPLIEHARTLERSRNEALRALAVEQQARREAEQANRDMAVTNNELADDCAALESRAAELERDLKEERAIVDRIWSMLGRPSYESLKGRSIYDLIADLERDAGRWNFYVQSLLGQGDEDVPEWTWAFSTATTLETANAAIDTALASRPGAEGKSNG